jgi:hypothetical protein
MADFYRIAYQNKQGMIEIFPKFIIGNSSDLMIRGGDFYAVWLEDKGLWSTDEQDVIRMIDRDLDKYVTDNSPRFDTNTKIKYMWDAESGSIDRWHKYCQKQQRDSFHMLDEKLIFSNSETNKKDYASKRLNYPLEPGKCPAYEKIISTIYSEEERHKIEWAIGSIVTGDSKTIQKFLVLYGAAGTGKSTILNIIQQLFEGYYSVFDAKALGSSSNSFALEAFKSNPLIAIQHDGDLSKIEDNTRLNSLVSHEMMTVNEKFKSTYASQFKCFLFMGTNKPVRITDAKSGLIRRLIDVSPSGKKVSPKEYNTLMEQVKFELGAIACHCRDVYLEDPGYYDTYLPMSMMIVYIAGLQAIPGDIQEAAMIDGATRMQRLFKITIPNMMPSITICTFLTITNSFKLFDQNLALTGGEPLHKTEMLALNIYSTFYGRVGAEGVGQAKAVVFFIIVVAIGLLQLKLTRDKEVQQ